MVFAVAPSIAPVIGGWIEAHLGWRWVFALNLPLAALIWIAAVLTIWSMVYYLQKALPEIRAKAR